ncbi:MAG: thioredoxin [Flammeovirgaceae bacterium]
MAKAINITDSNFEEVVLKSNKPVLVDFWATWCGPCLMMAPVVDELAGDYAEKAVIAKLDVDANPITAQKFGIRSIPTMLVFKNGKMVDKLVGASPKNILKTKLDAQLA